MVLLCSSFISIANIYTPFPGLAQSSPFLMSWLICTFRDSHTGCFSACCVLISIPTPLTAPLVFQSTCFICIDVSILFESFSGLQHLLDMELAGPALSPSSVPLAFRPPLPSSSLHLSLPRSTGQVLPFPLESLLPSLQEGI